MSAAPVGSRRLAARIPKDRQAREAPGATPRAARESHEIPVSARLDSAQHSSSITLAPQWGQLRLAMTMALNGANAF